MKFAVKNQWNTRRDPSVLAERSGCCLQFDGLGRLITETRSSGTDACEFVHAADCRATYSRKKMKVLLASIPASGHVNPLLVLARMLRNAGHETAIYTGSVFRKKVRAAGIGFYSLPADVDFDLTNVEAAFPELLQYAPGTQQALYAMQHVFTNPIPSQFRGLEAILNKFPADLIVHETAFFGVLPLLLGARASRPASACLSISTIPLPREDGAPSGPGLPPATDPAQREQYRSTADHITQILTDPVREHTNRILNKLGAQRLPGPVLESSALLSDLILQPCGPSFEFPHREPSGKKLHFIGPLFPEGSGEVPPQVKEAHEAGRSIVLVSQCTVANHDLRQLVAPVIEAFGDHAGKLILITTGGKPIDSIPCPLGPNSVAAPFMNFSKVFPYVDALVALGGYGTVTQALSCGVPMVLAGCNQDKPEIAARVAWTGSGVRLDTDTPSVAQLRESVGEVLSDPRYRASAEKLALEFAAFDAARDVPRLCETLVADYSTRTSAGTGASSLA
jgi:MGT family glycosyltransferase